MKVPGAVPEIVDTDDLRAGREIHPALLSVLPLVGRWQGYGSGVTPRDAVEFNYAQRISFVHDGRPFLAYNTHSWLLNPDGSVLRPAFREAGFLRPGPGSDDLELVVCAAAGLVSVFTGIAGDQRWEVATGAVGFTPTARQFAGERRLYALVDGDLAYAQELAMEPDSFRPHLQARLARDRAPAPPDMQH
jgi:nitrobindin-like protein